MMYLSDFALFVRDWFFYRHIRGSLFWFKKHHGLQWLRGQNFGDYLSLVVVGEMTRKDNLRVRSEFAASNRKLLAVGSILHFARDGDVIWGAGVNGKIAPERHLFRSLDVRMARGPLTKKFLEDRGISVSACYGDPALLLPRLFPEYAWTPVPGKVAIIPNMNEPGMAAGYVPRGMKLLSPFRYWKKTLYDILSSELVISSSLHGIIVAEAFGVPVRFVMPGGGETLFKYRDYYEGTGRSLPEPPSGFMGQITVRTGLEMSPPQFNGNAMIAAFPNDLFGALIL